MDDFNKKYPLIDILNVSRETCLEFETFASMVSEKNKEILLCFSNLFSNLF